MNPPLNIIYINSHDTGRYVEPYGHAVETPGLQWLADEGMLFRQAFTEFITIEPYLKKLDASKTEQIMNDFRNSYNYIRDKNQFITNATLISRQLKAVVAKA